MKIQNKISLTFVLVSTISVGLLTYIATDNALSTIKHEVENTLNGIADQKVMQFHSHIKAQEDSLVNFASIPWTADAISDLSASFKQGVESDSYQKNEDFYREGLLGIKERLDGYDVFLMNPEGDVVFSIMHESDFATNLKTGVYKETLLGQSFDDATTLLETKISEFKPYSPSQWNLNQNQTTPLSTSNTGTEMQAAFIAAPVFQGEALVGVLALQVKASNLNHFAADYSGLKQTGEVLIGKLEEDHVVFTAPIRHDPSAAFKLRHKIGSDKAIPLQRAVSGKRGSGFSADYVGTEILAAWRAIPELNLGLVVKIETSEAFAAAEQLKIKLILLGLLISLIAGFIAFYVSRKISYPIQLLHKAVTKISAGGEVNEKIKVNSNDETHDLADAFNEMNQQRFENEASMKANQLETQQALAQLSEQKFALDQHAIVAITDVRGNITFANKKFCDISGYSEAELLGQNHRLLKTGHHDVEFWTEMYRTVSKGKVWHAEVCNKAKEGHLYWVDTTIVPFMNRNNKPESYIAIRTDITERKRVEETFARNHEQLELVIKNTNIGIWDWQVQTGEVVFNPRWAEIIGYTLEELAPVDINTWMDHAHPDDLDESGKRLEQHWCGEAEQYIFEARMKHKQGHWVWVQDTGKVVEWFDDGRPKRMIGTHQDITERIAYEST